MSILGQHRSIPSSSRYSDCPRHCPVHVRVGTITGSCSDQLHSGMFFLPFSPRWLAKKGRTDEARTTLIRLHGGRRARLEIVEAEIQEMLAQIAWGESYDRCVGNMADHPLTQNERT